MAQEAARPLEAGAQEKIYEEFDHRIVPPSWQDRVWSAEEYKRFHAETVKDKAAIEAFWAEWAEKLPWFKKWDKVLDDSNPPFYRWFVGGETNLAYLAVDWQIKQGRRHKVAFIWEGEPWDEVKREPKEVRKITYHDLYRESNRLAFALREKLRVRKGEVVTLYLPMIPEIVFYMLAVQRLGAAHSIVFSGFSAQALAQRVLDAGSRIIVTADGLYRRGRVIPLKPMVDEAVRICAEKGHKVEHVIVVRRVGLENLAWEEERDLWHHRFVRGISRNVQVEPVPCGSEDFSFILYTSGTTGTPKGVQHSVGGYAVGVYTSTKLIFDLNDEDVYWCTADVGWITGHSYVIYGPLMLGATSVIYEGAPDYPAPDRWWNIIHRHGVTVFYTAPTAVRMLMKFPEEFVHRYDLSTLRIVNTVGEPINPEAFNWYFRNLGKENIVASSCWWMTETGQMILAHTPGLGKIYPLKPGTNGLPLPGVNVEVVDDEGKPCPPGVRGHLVVTTPWPAMMMTIYKDPQRYVDTYWSRFKDRFCTSDFAVKDPDGYVWVLGRADDVLKIAGHRIGTAEVESAMVLHPAVAEAACVGRPDPVKGEVPVIFTVLRHGFMGEPELVDEIKQHLRKVIGPIVATDAVIVFVDNLPKTRSGKIMRRILRAVIHGQPLGDVTTLEDGVAVEEATKAYQQIKAALRETAATGQ
ncbi:acetate/CoA ligase [Ammonifex degensii KC4]|uniref:Acetate--CoA ligase n=1 Tax=Ammonifex degensii (strain DSM 10501 / KC4) TaxID=429009 RepID=C9R9F1_AMMDK|nr:acetate--CoA ligase [Ammonifex degensii]ACX52930.1 acetate/CoA ligase [Ammonifex degensii KC4]